MNVIEGNNVSKKFQLFHEKEQTLRGYFVKKFRKEGSRRVEEFWALKNLTFAVQQGEIFGIVGENGSGKSTLLKLICGILRPTEGELRINGNIAALLELGSGFHPDLTGRENIYLNASIIGLKKREIDDKFEEIVRFAELEKFIDTPVKNYSSGMFVRLGFAVAININPDIVLVDEVLAVGDEGFQKKCMEKFNQFKKESKTIIIVSHGLDTIKDLCTRAIWLDAGELKVEGPPAMVVNQYLEEVAEREEREFKARNDQIRKQSKKRWGSGEVEIRDLSFHDKSLEEKATFQTGDQLFIKLTYFADQEIPNPVFGIGFFRDDGVYCYGTNTAIDGYDVGVVKGEGEIWMECDRLVMLPGHYFLDVAVFSADGKRTYDLLHWIYSFKVSSAKLDKGVFLQEHKWHDSLSAQERTEVKEVQR
jgi:ABC-type polysaccharide/polyol phosphate transport system ATPase subunit